MAMTRLSNQKACFLQNSTSEMPKPSDLKDLLDKVSKIVYRFAADILNNLLIWNLMIMNS